MKDVLLRGNLYKYTGKTMWRDCRITATYKPRREVSEETSPDLKDYEKINFCCYVAQLTRLCSGSYRNHIRP